VISAGTFETVWVDEGVIRRGEKGNLGAPRPDDARASMSVRNYAWFVEDRLSRGKPAPPALPDELKEVLPDRLAGQLRHLFLIDPDRAFEHAEACTAAHPTSTLLRCAAANIYRRGKRYDDAQRHLDEALALEAANPWALAQNLQLALERADLPEAGRRLEAARRHAPDNEVVRHFGRVLAQRLFARAAASCSRAIRQATGPDGILPVDDIFDP
jgi:predicted Zn-dependent protease